MSLRNALLGDVGGGGRRGLGDVVCTQSEGDYGVQAMQDLETIFAGVSGQPGAARYALAVRALVADRDRLLAMTGVQVLASGGASAHWCRWKALGQRADALTHQIASALGVEAPPAAPGGGGGWLDSIASAVRSLAVMGAVSYVVGSVIRRNKR